MGAPSRRVELAVYLLLAVVGVVPTLLVPGAIVGDGVDAYGTHWFYWWMRVCIERFADPGWTNFFFYPSGKDIFAHTGNNLVDAVMSVPFQWVFGPTLYQPIFVVALAVGNAIAFRPLARYVLGDGFAAFGATVLWQVNPFFGFELTAGRPTQAFAWYVPIATLFFLRCLRERDWRDGVKLGLAMGVVGWAYWFNTFFLAILFAAILPFELRDSADRRGALARIVLGAAVAGLVASPAVFLMTEAWNQGRVPIDSSVGSIFEPPRPVANNISSELHGLLLMELYGAPQFLQPAWGLPLLAALLFKVPVARGKARWLVGTLVVLAFAIGPAVAVSGIPKLVMPHYMVLYRYVPFFNRLWFPYRAVVAAFLPASLVLGALLTRVRSPRAALVALVVAGLAGQWAVGTFPYNHHVARSPQLLVSLKEEGGGVVFLPMKIQHDALMWQTEFELPTFGGMGESAPVFWPRDFRSRLGNAYVKALRGATMTPPLPAVFRDKDRASVRKWGFRWVGLRLSLFVAEAGRNAELRGETLDVLTAMQGAVDAITRVVGTAPVGLDGDVIVWDLDGTWSAPAEFELTPERLRAAAARDVESPVYETKLKDMGRTGTPMDRDRPKVPQ